MKVQPQNQINHIVQPIQKLQNQPQAQLHPQSQLQTSPSYDKQVQQKQQQQNLINRERTNNLINPIFNNYEPKIKVTENLKDDTLNILDKYVTDPEIKGVEELGK